MHNIFIHFVSQVKKLITTKFLHEALCSIIGFVSYYTRYNFFFIWENYMSISLLLRILHHK